MALLSQALHLGYLLSPHSAFQGHAAHTARWPAMLSPNGSSDTCISDGVFHIPMPCFHGAIPVYPKVLLHFSIMLHGAAQARGTRPLETVGDKSQEPLEPDLDRTANAAKRDTFQQQALNEITRFIRDEVLLETID